MPNDDNGRVLRQLYERGDSLAKPRMVEFQLVFQNRSDSLEFARLVSEKEYEVCLSYYEERDMWQAEVKIYIIPEHAEIARIESDLSERARAVGGKSDGWCCMVIKDRNENEPNKAPSEADCLSRLVLFPCCARARFAPGNRLAKLER